MKKINKTTFVYISWNKIITSLLNSLTKGEFSLINFKGNPFDLNNNINQFEIEKNFGFLNILFRKQLVSKLNKIKPDYLFVTDIYRGEFFQSFYYKLKNPKTNLILYSEVQRLPKNPIKFILGYILLPILFKFYFSKKISKIACFTSDGVDFYRKLLPQRKDDISLLPPTINTKIFLPKKNRLYLNNGTLNILIVARMIPYKNYFDLLKSLKYLKEELNFHDFKLSILGEGPLKNKIIRKIKRYGLEQSVVFLKRVKNNEIVKYYHNNDVLILPSFNEAIGMVVPEAMACGTPVIISDTVGAKTYVKDGENGLIFKTGNYKDLANKILKLNDTKKLKIFGENASNHIKKHFSLECNQHYFDKVIR